MTLSLYLNNYYETGFNSFKEKVPVPLLILFQVQIKLRAQRKIKKNRRCSHPNYPKSSKTPFSQTQTSATIPLEAPPPPRQAIRKLPLYHM